MRIARKACFEFGGATFEALVIGVTVGKKALYNCLHGMQAEYSMQSTACKAQRAKRSMQSAACKAQHVCNSAKHVLIVDQLGFLMEHFLARLQ
jgi:DNA transposition AAA+ family ATPase